MLDGLCAFLVINKDKKKDKYELYRVEVFSMNLLKSATDRDRIIFMDLDGKEWVFR